MKKAVIQLFFILWAFQSFAQPSNFVDGIIVDSETKIPLEQVTIYNQTSSFGEYSNLDGTFKIGVELLPCKIVFSYVGYKNFLLELDRLPDEPLLIELEPSSFRLSQIEVTSALQIEQLSEKTYTVRDFLLLDDQILLLSYANMFSQNKLVLKNWKGEVISELDLGNGDVEKLHRGCLGSIHLIGRNNGFEISLLQDQIQIIKKYPRKQFKKLIQPCIHANDDFLYTEKYTSRKQVKTFQIISKLTGQLQKEIRVIDELNIARAKDDFQLQMEAGLQLTWGQQQAWNTIMYKPIFSPLVQVKNELCLFNHTAGALEFYTADGIQQRTIPISYHQERKWDKLILLDKKEESVYTVYDSRKGKSVHEINLEDGSTENILYFKCRLVEKMEIQNGYLFYLESSRTGRNRVLHRVRL
ncbi:MAG: carboxypeptidase-like regulatory domain-containing protein [Bacteroidota bacterium]